MKFILIEGVHINVDQIRSLTWRRGDLCIWYAGQHFFECWSDPDQTIYKRICDVLGIEPDAETLRLHEQRKAGAEP